MTHIYEGLINELKSKFYLKDIKFTTKNFRLILNKEITEKNKNKKKG